MGLVEMSTQRRVVYVVSETLVKVCLLVIHGEIPVMLIPQVAALLPSNRGRSTLVHSLASALGIFQKASFPNLRVFRPSPASVKELCSYHDSDYIGVHSVSFRAIILV